MKHLKYTALFALAFCLALSLHAQRGLKRLPQAKTQQEYNDYTASAAAAGGAALETAADQFAARYPESELRLYLYSRALHAYQDENKSGKILAVGEKVLAIDPDHSVALALSANALADSLTDTDPGREQKIAQIKQYCERASKTMESAMVLVPGVTPEEITAYKNSLRIMVHSALGTMELKTGNDSAAEKDFKTVANLSRTNGNPAVYYHLALAQDHQKKYAEAMNSVEQALQLASSDPDLQQLAEAEHERLLKLTGHHEKPPS